MNKIVLTVDVEDWFCVRNLQDLIARKDWGGCEQRIHTGLDFLLEELALKGRKATFFVLGWIAEKHPDVVRKIALAGHEIASHGFAHQALDELTPDEFRRDLKKSLESLSALTGKKIAGYRAPSFSITERTLWALEILKDNGIAYDSSIYPIRHPNYGIPSFSPEARTFRGVIEVPLTTGGGYFRLYPYGVTKRLLEKVSKQRPPIIYFHPWEFDADQPRPEGLPFSTRFRHYVGLRQNRAKFRRLLEDFETCTMREFLTDKGFAVN